MSSQRYSWVVRNGDDEHWLLLPYRWVSRADALDTAEHWARHYEQVKTVEVVDHEALTAPVWKEIA